MIRTQISLTAEQAEALRRLAGRRGCSRAAIVREPLDALLDDAGRADRVERARAAIGRFGSGRGDTAGHHDAAVGESFGG